MPAANHLDPRSPLAIWGAELRSHRETAGLTQPQFAQLINYSVAQISAVENAQQHVTDEFARHCDDGLALNGALVRLLHRLQKATPQEIYPEWFRPWLPEEQRATVIRSFHLGGGWAAANRGLRAWAARRR